MGKLLFPLVHVSAYLLLLLLHVERDPYSQMLVELGSWTIVCHCSLSFAAIIACVSPLSVSVSLVDMLFLVFLLVFCLYIIYDMSDTNIKKKKNGTWLPRYFVVAHQSLVINVLIKGNTMHSIILPHFAGVHCVFQVFLIQF